MIIHENHSLKAYNTFGIDVLARYFASVHSTDEFKALLSDPKYNGVDKLILGGGSNILFTKNTNSLVLKNELKGIKLINEDADYYYITAGAGERWHDFVMHCVNNNYGGIENLSLIPGNVGASPMQNIGAYGVEIKDTFHELEALNIATLEMEKFTKAQCEFGYRESIFKRKAKGKYIITSVTFRLNKVPVYNTSYGAIEKELELMGVQELSLKRISDAVCAIRNSKLPNPDEIGNAGSFFKNPVVPAELFKAIQTDFPDVVAYKNSDMDMKLAAGWLIERCGWKGKRFGDAGVHKNQALVLVNYANARGEELLDLSEKIIASVSDKFGVVLEREVNIY